MTTSEEDMVFAAFLASAAEHAPDLPADFLQKVYAIQKNHRFDRDDDVSLQEMSRLIEEYLNKSNDEGLAL